MKKTMLIIAAAICFLTAVFFMWKQHYAKTHILDGDGMVRKNIGIEDDACGKWLSDRSPQWSAVLEKYRLNLYHYGKETASTQVGNYAKPDKDGVYTQIELQKEIIFSWPYSAYEKAEFMDIYLDADRLQLTFRLDDSTNETFSFRKAEEGEKEETEHMTLDENTVLTAVSFHQQGTYMSPYYILRKNNDSYEVCRSFDEMHIPEPDGDEEGTGEAEIFEVSEEDVRMLTKQLLEYSILAWDGFNESKSNDPGMLDGDSEFMLKLLFSDGTTVSASGRNVQPANGNEIISLIVRFFMAAEMTGESTD